MQENSPKLQCVVASCQDNDSVVAVLEKVASLDDKEEVAKLAEEAQGRKFFLQTIARYLPHLFQSFALRNGIQKCD